MRREEAERQLEEFKRRIRNLGNSLSNIIITCGNALGSGLRAT